MILGVPMAVLGAAVVRRRVDLSLGGWTAENAEPASFDRANRKIGMTMRVSGGVMALIGAVIIVVRDQDFAVAVGLPVLLVGSLAVTGSAFRWVTSIQPQRSDHHRN